MSFESENVNKNKINNISKIWICIESRDVDRELIN